MVLASAMCMSSLLHSNALAYNHTKSFFVVGLGGSPLGNPRLFIVMNFS